MFYGIFPVECNNFKNYIIFSQNLQYFAIVYTATRKTFS